MSCLWRGFYGIVDPDICLKSPLEVTDGLLAGGCAVVQLRWKTGSDRDILALANAIQARCSGAGVPFVMNDRFDLAKLAGADGLHLGQDDMPIAEARKHFEGIIGLSTHTLAEAKEAAKYADLIGFGPVFATTTKENADPVVGLNMLASVCQAVDVPVVAIGGLTLKTAPLAKTAGAALIAAISAVVATDNPEAATRSFVERLQ